MYGLVIDDFVALSRVSRESFQHGPSDGAEGADQMQRAYEDVKLIPNKKKAFRDELQASFWGADVDGEAGVVRGSLKRAIPLTGIILRLVATGHCCGKLMQAILGSVISLFLFRRRFLALLDSCFESYRGRQMDEIYVLSGRCKSDLLMIAVLMPLAATNLRASPPDVVAASDASNWGEAGVFCRISPKVGKELMRHSLRKSVWTRLLSPGRALLRAHGELPEEDELPDGEETFKANPLWTLLAEALEYKLLFARERRGRRHINIGEVRGMLRTEKLLGLQKPSRRILLGADSQVGLGAVSKGRSSSTAINEELCRSLPWMISLDSYLDLMYYNTSSNRADDPTRGKEIGKAVRKLPSWWHELEQGLFQQFDVWMFEHGLDDEHVAGLPDFSELCGGVSLAGTLPEYLKVESGVKVGSSAPGNLVVKWKCQAPVPQMRQPLPRVVGLCRVLLLQRSSLWRLRSAVGAPPGGRASFWRLNEQGLLLTPELELRIKEQMGLESHCPKRLTS